MGRNILIFSDGTGQAGGLLPDETRTNIYKLYRAARCGPDSTVDPDKQLAFYDPGLGSQSDGGRIPIGFLRKARNVISQATGLGITANIIDCYAAILSLWRPGDRVYLFGFSRGAYTIRCVGGVMALCGIPTHVKGSPLRYDAKTIRTLATEAVKEVYQYGASIKGDPFKDLRLKRAECFRREHGSGANGNANAYPYFIGVFDTVAALGVPRKVRFALAIVAGFMGGVLAAGIAWVLSSLGLSFARWFALVCVGAAVGALYAYLKTHLRYHPLHKRFYLSDWSMKFYDNKLNRHVGYARHALSIDEARADFEQVSWVFDDTAPKRDQHAPELLRQMWFAGDHSDIGGSYIENESRLSDNALQWMGSQLNELPCPILIDDLVLQTYPSPAGPQHDEARKGFAGIWGALGFRWPIKWRTISPDAPLHPSVLERFALPEVLIYDRMMPYRPEPLRFHHQVKQYYT